MSIEQRFLQKAIEDKNYVSFNYDSTSYDRIIPQKIIQQDMTYTLKTKQQNFKIESIKNLKIHKEKF